MDYAKSRGVRLMPPVSQADLEKPVFKKYWTAGASEDAEEYLSGQVNKIDMSKFAALENLFRTRAEDAVILPVPAIPAPPPEEGEEEAYTHAERPPTNSRDPFSGSEFVFGLSQCNFKNFIDRKDVAVVMYYGDQNNDKTLWARMQLNKAARATRRLNHGFAMVNCAQQRDLCQEQGVCTLPMYKMYSRGNKLGSIREVITFNTDVIKRFVECAPILREPIGPNPPKKSD
ncbi:hypothetical protein BsWGS_17005 [Bradybaena similaris]